MFAATVLTLFPEMFPGPLGLSLAGDALARGLWSLEARDIREHGLGRHRAVDDTPAGGGPGMVMRADVLAASLDAALQPDDAAAAADHEPARRAVHAARKRANGRRGPGSSSSARVSRASTSASSTARALIEVSIGDYVLSGGEIAALAVLDACVRLIPGVMGKLESGEQESFESGLLEYPHYTRPREWEGRAIPDVLLSGDHQRIDEWRQRRGRADHARAAARSVLRSPHPALRAAFSRTRERGSTASAPASRRGSRRSRAASCGRASRPRRISPAADRVGTWNRRGPRAAPASRSGRCRGR